MSKDNLHENAQFVFHVHILGQIKAEDFIQLMWYENFAIWEMPKMWVNAKGLMEFGRV